jgi:AcrR family transcriptional regulator
MKKQPKITENTKQMFVEAFCFLYRQKPIEKISIQEIAKKAGYNRSTFYQYFLDIDDLLSYVEKSFLDYIYKKRRKIDINSDSFINILVEIYETKAIICNALLGAYGSQRFLDKVKDKLHVPGLTLQDGNKFIPYLIEYRLSSSLALFKLWLQRGAEKDLPLKDFVDIVLTLYKNGISSFK